MAKKPAPEDLDVLVALSEDDIRNMTYETAMERLEEVVDALEREGTPLNLGLRLYELGTALGRHCSSLLDKTEERMVQLLGDLKDPREEPFNPEKDGR